MEIKKDPYQIIKDEMRRQRKFWNVFICLPLCYLMVCSAIDKFFFKPNDIKGFFITGKTIFDISLLIGGVFAFSVQILILILKKHYHKKLRRLLLSPERLAPNLRIMFVALACICDLTSATGMILFLLYGKMFTMLVFGILGFLYYAQIYPSDNIIKQIHNPHYNG